MSKKHFIALADCLRNMEPLDHTIYESLADFCQKQNPNFKRERWLGYIYGDCGPNGGRIR